MKRIVYAAFVAVLSVTALAGCDLRPASVREAAEDPLRHPINNPACVGMTVTIGTERKTVSGAGSQRFAPVTIHLDGAFEGKHAYEGVQASFYDYTLDEDLGSPPVVPHDVSTYMPEGHKVRIGVAAVATDGRQGLCSYKDYDIPVLAPAPAPSSATAV